MKHVPDYLTDSTASPIDLDEGQRDYLVQTVYHTANKLTELLRKAYLKENQIQKL